MLIHTRVLQYYPRKPCSLRYLHSLSIHVLGRTCHKMAEVMTEASLHFRLFKLKKALISDTCFLEPLNCYFGLGAELGQVLCTANTTNSLFQRPVP